MRVFITTFAVAVACLAGCSRPKPQPMVEEKPSVEVNAPGVDVKVEPKEGVKVEAPGVEVDTDPPK